MQKSIIVVLYYWDRIMEQKIGCDYIDFKKLVQNFIDYKIREYYEPDNLYLVPNNDDLLLVIDKQKHPSYCGDEPIKLLSNSEDFYRLYKSSNIGNSLIEYNIENLTTCKIYLQVIEKDDYIGNRHHIA